MSPLAQIVIALAIFAAGGATGIKWQHGVQARADLAAAELRASDARQQRQTGDKAAAAHAAVLVTLNHKLGAARAHIAKLSNRPCLDADTVRLLNTLGAEPGATPASHAEGAPPAVAPGQDERFATEQDTADAIATCRAGYGTLSSQLNQILDIEDKRHPP